MNPTFTRRVAFVLWLLICLNAQAFADDRPVVRIGLIYPLSGTMSMFGEDMAKAVPLLERTFNSSQSKYEYRLILEDGKFGQGNAAITAARKLVEIDGARFLVVGSSGEILQIAPFVEGAKVLAVAGFASNPNVRNAGDYVFRTYIDLERGMRLVVDDFEAKGLKRIALITENASFCLGNKSSLQKFLGDRLVFAEDFAPGDADFKTLLAKARSERPDAYYLNVGAPVSFITLVRQLKDTRVQEPIYTYYVPSLKDVQQDLGPKLDGVIYLDFPDVNESDSVFDRLRAELEQSGPIKAPFNFRTNYNAVKVVFDAISEVGPDTAAAKSFLYNYDRPSATGRLRFDQNGDVLDLDLALKTYGR